MVKKRYTLEGVSSFLGPERTLQIPDRRRSLRDMGKGVGEEDLLDNRQYMLVPVH
jgi:hypothetical protein